MSGTALYLSTIVGRDVASLELRTKLFSPEALEGLLGDDPAAITLAPLGTGTPERLLDILAHRSTDLASTRHTPGSDHLWIVYQRDPHERSAHRMKVQMKDLRHELLKLQSMGKIAAFITEELRIFDAAIEKAMAASAIEGIQAKFDDPSDEDLNAENRQALLKHRKAMLDKVPTYDSEAVATALDSTTINASNYAAGVRVANRIFGVRIGQEWRYPKFQFDPRTKQPYSQLKAILTHLPDERGWSRLHWFLTPHERLSGKAPLDLWPDQRDQVVEAAKMEHWRERL